jgi:hypothetical protein
MNESAVSEIRVRSGRRELVATDETISIGDKEFRLTDVTRVVYRAAARINQASYTLGLARGDLRCTFMFDAYRRGTELEDARENWRRLVALIEGTVCPRIAARAARTIVTGGTVPFGGTPSGRIDADAIGLCPHRPFAKPIPWSQITGADTSDGQVRIWTVATGPRKPKLTIDTFGWNAVVLPRVVAAFAATNAPSTTPRPHH